MGSSEAVPVDVPPSTTAINGEPSTLEAKEVAPPTTGMAADEQNGGDTQPVTSVAGTDGPSKGDGGPPEVTEQCYRPKHLFDGKGLHETIQSIMTVQSGLVSCFSNKKPSSTDIGGSLAPTPSPTVPANETGTVEEDDSIRGIPANGKL